jgi:TolB protein
MAMMAFYPRWSPDSRQIAMAQGNPDTSESLSLALVQVSDVYQMTPSSQEKYLTELPSTSYGWAEEWSPDGKHLVYQAPQKIGLPWWETKYDIWKVNLATGRAAQLTTHDMNDQQPSWSPDGAHIAFATNRADGVWEIYIMKADGSGQHPLTVRTEDQDPTWSPDGKRIAFVSSRDGNLELYVMNADGSAQMRLTDNTADDVDTAWTPDGRILFASNRDGDFEIYVVNADGTNLQQLTHDQDEDRWPSWRR